jgi:hypothetical protein
MRSIPTKIFILIAVLIPSLLVMAILTNAQGGMWHSASEIGPGTFQPGVYNFIDSTGVSSGLNINDLSHSNNYNQIFKFPKSDTESVGLYLESDAIPLWVYSKGNMAARFVSNDIAISTWGNLLVSGNILSNGGPITAGHIGSLQNPWLSVYTNELCLDSACRTTWPSGGPGGAIPSLSEVTKNCDAGIDCEKTDVGIETGGLHLTNNGVITSENGNVIIRLGT